MVVLFGPGASKSEPTRFQRSGQSWLLTARSKEPSAKVLSFPRCEFPTSNALVAESISPLIGRRMFVLKMAACLSSATILLA